MIRDNAGFLFSCENRRSEEAFLIKNTKNIVRSLSMVTQLGVSMLAPVVLCICLGMWLDEKFGWSSTAVLVVLGIMAGARNTWILAKQVGLPQKKERRQDETEDK